MADLIKVVLPGEKLWAEVVGETADGRIRAELRNESIHDIAWGTPVELGHDGMTVVAPDHVLRRAEESVAEIVEEFRQIPRWRQQLDDLRFEVADRFDHLYNRAALGLLDLSMWCMGLVCRVRGHAERVRGDWPEDSVCPRCGDLEVSIGFSVSVVPPKDEEDGGGGHG